MSLDVLQIASQDHESVAVDIGVLCLEGSHAENLRSLECPRKESEEQELHGGSVLISDEITDSLLFFPHLIIL